MMQLFHQVLSCLVTNAALGIGFALHPGSLKSLDRSMVREFALVCVAIAVDLGCSNVAISLISVALQQCVRATAPAATMLVERVCKRRPQKLKLVGAVGLVVVGPIIAQLGSDLSGGSLLGIFMQLAAVLGGSLKSVYGHTILTEHKKRLGILSFLFWAEWFTAALLLPWAILAGEVADMWRYSIPLADWAVLWFTAGVGGLRIFAQLLFLQQTSATSLAISSIAVNALSSTLSIFFFHTPLTVLLVVGVAETVVATSLYTYLKLQAKRELLLGGALLQQGAAPPTPKP